MDRPENNRLVYDAIHYKTSIAYRKQLPLNERWAPLAVNGMRAPLRRKLHDKTRRSYVII